MIERTIRIHQIHTESLGLGTCSPHPMFRLDELSEVLVLLTRAQVGFPCHHSSCFPSLSLPVVHVLFSIGLIFLPVG